MALARASRLAASRTVAKAGTRMSSRVLPAASSARKASVRARSSSSDSAASSGSSALIAATFGRDRPSGAGRWRSRKSSWREHRTSKAFSRTIWRRARNAGRVIDVIVRRAHPERLRHLARERRLPAGEPAHTLGQSMAVACQSADGLAPRSSQLRRPVLELKGSCMASLDPGHRSALGSAPPWRSRAGVRPAGRGSDAARRAAGPWPRAPPGRAATPTTPRSSPASTAAASPRATSRSRPSDPALPLPGMSETQKHDLWSAT